MNDSTRVVRHCSRTCEIVNERCVYSALLYKEPETHQIFIMLAGWMLCDDDETSSCERLEIST